MLRQIGLRRPDLFSQLLLALQMSQFGAVLGRW
jgi:hypothetical protein